MDDEFHINKRREVASPMADLCLSPCPSLSLGVDGIIIQMACKDNSL